MSEQFKNRNETDSTTSQNSTARTPIPGTGID